MRRIKLGRFHTTNIKNELIEKVTGYYQSEIERMDTTEKKILESEENLKSFWRKNFINNINLTRYLKVENGNFLVPYFIGLKPLYKIQKNEPINQKDVEELFHLKNKKETLDVWGRIQDVIKSVIGIQLEVFLNEDNIPTIEVDQKWFNLNGSGIREVLRMVLDIEMNRANIILLEEPEVYLHYELERKFSEYLSSFENTNKQLFLTTHSTAMVEKTLKRSIFIVKKKELNGRVISEVQELTNDMLIEAARELGINVHSLLIKECLIFVEGVTDELILSNYLNTFYSSKVNKIGIVNMQGESHYQHYSESISMGVFRDSGLQTYFILDSDNKTDEFKKNA